MNKLKLKNYNLHTTLLGGQAFNWDFDGEKYVGFMTDKVVVIKPENDYIYWQTYPQNDDLDFMTQYLRLDFDYNKILNLIKKDEHLEKSYNYSPGLRLLKQDFDQTTLSFILSSNNNIKAIRKSVRDLAFKFGDKLVVEDQTYHLFPRTEVIANLSMEDLLSTKIGYRAKYFKATAQELSKYSQIHQNLDDEEVFLELQKLPGVGPKIADCILVFALTFDNVTPIDVWVQRILSDLYGLDSKINYKNAKSWMKQYFEGNAAWAGQFLFEYYRKNYKKEN